VKVICTGIGKGHDQQPGTLRVSFEDVLPPYATVLTLTVPTAEVGKFQVGSFYEVVEPVAAPAPEVVVADNSNTMEEAINAT